MRWWSASAGRRRRRTAERSGVGSGPGWSRRSASRASSCSGCRAGRMSTRSCAGSSGAATSPMRSRTSSCARRRFPNDPRFGEQWALRNTGQAVDGVPGTVGEDVNARAAWDLTQGSDDVVVAVADSGINVGHPDLAPNVWHNPGESGGGREDNGVDDDGNGAVDDVFPRDQVDGDYDPVDENGHGTEVAGTLAARGNDGFGTTGLAWRARIMPIRVLDRWGSGDTARRSLRGSATRRSGARRSSTPAWRTRGRSRSRTRSAISRETLFVVAAGNSGRDLDGGDPDWPCAYTFANLICVGAADADGRLAPFSSYGATSVDLAAPGVSVLAPALGHAAAHGLDRGLRDPAERPLGLRRHGRPVGPLDALVGEPDPQPRRLARRGSRRVGGLVGRDGGAAGPERAERLPAGLHDREPGRRRKLSRPVGRQRGRQHRLPGRPAPGERARDGLVRLLRRAAGRAPARHVPQQRLHRRRLLSRRPRGPLHRPRPARERARVRVGHVVRLAVGGRGRRAAPVAASGRVGRRDEGRDPRRRARAAAPRGQDRRQPHPRRPGRSARRPRRHRHQRRPPRIRTAGIQARRPSRSPAHSRAAPLRGPRSALVPSADGL